MTDDLPAEGADDPQATLRSLQRRLRREKRVLERVNPVAEPERYAEHFTRVVDLEAARRDLREALGPDAGGADDEDGG